MVKNIFHELAEKYESGEWEWRKGLGPVFSDDKPSCCILGGIARIARNRDNISEHYALNYDTWKLYQPYVEFLTTNFTRLQVWKWNDASDRTKEEVIELLKSAGDAWGKQYG